MNIQKNIPLKDYTTFKIGGPAEYFADAKSIEDVQEAFAWAKENNQPVRVLGGGSNMLVSDAGLKGLVIKLSLDKLEFNEDKVIVGPGVVLSYLLNQSLSKDLTGLEFTAGIPGTVGGATRGNAGTYGVAMDSVVQKIKYLDENQSLQEITSKDAEFAYRHSIFKTKDWIILEVELKLQKGDVKAAQELVKERLQYRQDTQPNLPSAGCIFKNVHFKDVDLKDLKVKNIEIDKFDKFKKIPAAYIIEKAGLKGHIIGGAQVSDVHANYIVNQGEATAEQVIMLISFIKQQVRDKYGVQLQEEVQLLV
ncbi:MAG: UDP-N-acetylmuramate dehydrogenase [Candidatus Komeilibacteria bacterium]|jgi:UDP-N-acetylmuramate dehydrogenase|nr:UDP-N-acetylmuramate dehydrogenase [Candidatus Komeilibacteria bacterium]MBT4447178.1 UDP-N-acetylmuramate dehydrogenase [Candidatus Komeilibacteria bacterium]